MAIVKLMAEGWGQALAVNTEKVSHVQQTNKDVYVYVDMGEKFQAVKVQGDFNSVVELLNNAIKAYG